MCGLSSEICKTFQRKNPKSAKAQSHTCDHLINDPNLPCIFCSCKISQQANKFLLRICRDIEVPYHQVPSSHSSQFLLLPLVLLLYSGNLSHFSAAGVPKNYKTVMDFMASSSQCRKNSSSLIFESSFFLGLFQKWL